MAGASLMQWHPIHQLSLILLAQWWWQRLAATGLCLLAQSWTMIMSMVMLGHPWPPCQGPASQFFMTAKYPR